MPWFSHKHSDIKHNWNGTCIFKTVPANINYIKFCYIIKFNEISPLFPLFLTKRKVIMWCQMQHQGGQQRTADNHHIDREQVPPQNGDATRKGQRGASEKKGGLLVFYGTQTGTAKVPFFFALRMQTQFVELLKQTDSLSTFRWLPAKLSYTM